MKKEIRTPIDIEELKKLRAGDTVLITGTVYTARDAAHKRMVEALAEGKDLPFPIENAILYYLGPTPAAPGQIIGSAGPTTSSRMDLYTPDLLSKGLKIMIGKGRRNKEVVDSIVDHNAVYLAAIGGAGALLSKKIKSFELIAYEDLGTEAILKLEVSDFPAIVVIDSLGNNQYDVVLL